MRRITSCIKNLLVYAVCIAVFAVAAVFASVGNGCIADARTEIVGNSEFSAVSSEIFDKTPAEIAVMTKYDSRDYGFVTSVKDQGSSNICWAYASAAASETSILRKGADPAATSANLKLSPEAIAYARHNRGADPLGNTNGEYSGSNWFTTAGDPSYSALLMSQWCGPSREGTSVTSDHFKNSAFRLENAVMLKAGFNVPKLDVNKVKLMIAEYGAVTFSYNNVRETEYYNPVNEAGTNSYPHACTVVGWDDEIEASRFVPRGATQNGGWIVKNSYSSLPYFYLSYDSTCSTVWAFDYAAKSEYDYNYFYDYSLTDGLNSSLKIKKAANVFEAKKGTDTETETVRAVNVGFIGNNVTCNVRVYTDLTDETKPESGTLAGRGSAFFDYEGLRTVKLDAPVAIKCGEKFSVVAEVSNEQGSAYLRMMTGRLKPSYYCKDYWTSMNATARIKAYTTVEPSEPAPPQIPESIETAQITLDASSYVYDGQSKSPTVTVRLNGTELINNVDYTVEYSNNVNAGTATVKIKGIENYTGETTAAFTITKAERPPVFPQNAEIEYNGELSEIVWADGWSLSAEDADIEIPCGESRTLTLVYFDSANYQTYTTTVTITRAYSSEQPPISEQQPPKNDETNTKPDLLWLWITLGAVAAIAVSVVLSIYIFHKKKKR